MRALLLLLLLLVHFLVQGKSECHFFNGTQQVQYLQSYFYDRQEYLRFDSNLGKFKAITELGQVDADAWNKDKRILEDAMATVDRFCRYNYRVYNYNAPRPKRLFGRRGESQVGFLRREMLETPPQPLFTSNVKTAYLSQSDCGPCTDEISNHRAEPPWEGDGRLRSLSNKSINMYICTVHII